MFHQYYGIPNDASMGEDFMARFPILFQNRKKSMKETCMCWGIAVPRGWYYIIEQLCTVLEFYNIDIGKKYNLAIVADQVKEKFGTIRFYYTVRHVDDNGMVEYDVDSTLTEEDNNKNRIVSDYIEMLADSAISEADELTTKTCTDCGVPLTKDNEVETKGWITYICKKCDEKRQKKCQEWLDQQNSENQNAQTGGKKVD